MRWGCSGVVCAFQNEQPHRIGVRLRSRYGKPMLGDDGDSLLHWPCDLAIYCDGCIRHIVTLASIVLAYSDPQASWESVLCSLPCRFQHCLNASICMGQRTSQ